MSRKDYVRFAQVINESPLSVDAKTPLAEEFADLFADDNPAFDRERFLTACGVR